MPESTASGGVTEILAKFVAKTGWDDLPAEATHQAKRSLMNFFAVALTGCRNETVETALRTLAMFSGGKQAGLIGRRERIDALNAAFLNAAGSNVLDFCDTHVPTAIHPTAPLAPPLLALGEMQRVSGRDLLLAFVLGQEIECRVGLAISPSHYNRGWHITATCGVFGAAAGSGKLLALSPDQIVWALGIAATQASGLCECLGTPAKSVGVGQAARGGFFAALLAKENFEGPAEPLAGKQGYYNALAETPKLEALTEGLGAHWEIMLTSYKPYPCGFVLHPALDCVLDWRRDHPDDAVERVVVTGNPLISLRANRPHITAGRESQVSVQHSVAAALVTGKAGLDQFTDACVNDPQVLALRNKVELRQDPAIPTVAARVTITTLGGKTYELSQPAARGSDANPMSDKDLENKLRDAATIWNPRHDIAPLIDAIWQVDKSGDIASLAALTVPRG
jgi:2-methylcitrate dehydratase PrpD